MSTGTPPPGPAERDTRIRCPKDGSLMEKLRIGGTTVDRCARCGSMWFDARELDAVLSTRGGATALDIGPIATQAPARLLGRMLCPRDQSPLVEIADATQRHVEFNGCPTCGGALLDAGDLVDLSEITLRERLRAAMRKK